jgi:hypothetical protein
MQEQQLFLQNKLIPALRQVQAAQAPLWGKMNARQMVEHLLDSVEVEIITNILFIDFAEELVVFEIAEPADPAYTLL